MTANRIFYILFALLLYSGASSPLFSQDYAAVDLRAQRVPHGTDVDALAKALSKDCANDREKVRSFFIWMTYNINYDVSLKSKTELLGARKVQKYESPVEVLKRKKAICGGFSHLFTALCQSAGIPSLVVEGLSKKSTGEISEAGHAWNVVLLDGKWQLIDPTWGAGSVDNQTGKYKARVKEAYFLADPEAFILDHCPYDPLFQCLPNPIAFSEFALPEARIKALLEQKRSKEPMALFAHVGDSLTAYSGLDSASLYFTTGRRALALDRNATFGCWAMGEYYSRLFQTPMDAYYAGFKDLKKLKNYPNLEWLDQQQLRLDAWEAGARACVNVLKKAKHGATYAENAKNSYKYAETCLNACLQEQAQCKETRKSLSKGVKVRYKLD